MGMPPKPKVYRYTRRAESTGWLSVRLTKGGGLASLCEYTQVEILREAEGRTYFKITDGYISVGEEASLTTANAGVYLSSTGPGRGALLKIVYDGPPIDTRSTIRNEVLKQQWAILKFGENQARVTLNSVWGGSYTPLAPGTHAILAPDYSHAKISTAGYAAAARGMVGNNTWFPIGLGGTAINSSRYVHVGHLSEGCVTVYEIEKWTALYTYLISNRVPGSSGKRVGQIVVSNPTARR